MGFECLENGRQKVTQAVNWILRRESPIDREDTSYVAQYLQRFHDVFERTGSLSRGSLGDIEDIHHSLGDLEFSGMFFTQSDTSILVLNARVPSLSSDPLERAMRLVIKDKTSKGPYGSSLTFETVRDFELIRGKKEPLKNAKARPHLDKLLDVLSGVVEREDPSLQSASEIHIPVVENENLQYLDLQLDAAPVLDHLAVFIRDPHDFEKYWFRKIRVVSSGVALREGQSTPYVDMGVYDMGVLNLVPCLEKDLDKVIEHIKEGEIMISRSSDEGLKAMRAIVGVARYNGSAQLTLEDLISLTGLKYHSLKAIALN